MRMAPLGNSSRTFRQLWVRCIRQATRNYQSVASTTIFWQLRQLDRSWHIDDACHEENSLILAAKYFRTRAANLPRWSCRALWDYLNLKLSPWLGRFPWDAQFWGGTSVCSWGFPHNRASLGFLSTRIVSSFACRFLYKMRLLCDALHQCHRAIFHWALVEWCHWGLFERGISPLIPCWWSHSLWQMLWLLEGWRLCI